MCSLHGIIKEYDSIFTEVGLISEWRNCEGRGGSLMSLTCMLIKCEEPISQFLLNSTIPEEAFRYMTLQQTPRR